MGGKVSILGFFGITPNVDVAVGSLDSMLQLTFMIGFGAVTDAEQYLYSVVILNPDGSELIKTPRARVNTLTGKPGLLVATFPFAPKKVGVRSIKVIINDESRFESQFMIRQASTQELAALPPGVSLK